MTPVATTFFFYFLSAIAIASAIGVITRRNPVHSALLLILTAAVGIRQELATALMGVLR